MKKPRTKEDILYHLARLAFCAGQTCPWHMAVHALRQGLGYEGKKLDYKDYPDLVKLIEHLEKANKELYEPS